MNLRRVLVPTVAMAAALATAGPAHAIIKGGSPPDEAPCPYGGTVHPHGTIITITTTTPGGVPVTQKWRCNNGKWDPARTTAEDAATATPGMDILNPPGP